MDEAKGPKTDLQAAQPMESQQPEEPPSAPSNSGQQTLHDSSKPKPRKPYIITKQREKWTEEEHTKFLEALKLYGRAWRKIEEHVSTKTAVQIRSHAQKFMNKLERKRDTGSTENGEGISIPPPRPKRKPARPYPRKVLVVPDNSGSAAADASGINGGGATATVTQGGGGDNGGSVAAANCQQQSKLSLPAPPRSAQLPQPLIAGLQHLHLQLPMAFQAAQPRTPAAAAAVAAAAVRSQHHQQQQILQERQQLSHYAEVTDATVAAVAAAASAAAAAAAAAVVAAAGQQVQAHLQAHPPQGFPFFGLPPSLLAQVTLQNPALEGMPWGPTSNAKGNVTDAGNGSGSVVGGIQPPYLEGNGNGVDDGLHGRAWSDPPEGPPWSLSPPERGHYHQHPMHHHHRHHHQHHRHHSLDRSQQQQALAEATATTTDAENPTAMLIAGDLMALGMGGGGGQESRGSDGNSVVTERDGEQDDEDGGVEADGDDTGPDVGGEDREQAAQSNRMDLSQWTGTVPQAELDQQGSRALQYWQLLGMIDSSRPPLGGGSGSAGLGGAREGHGQVHVHGLAHGHGHGHGALKKSLSNSTSNTGSAGAGLRGKGAAKTHASLKESPSGFLRDPHKKTAARNTSPCGSDMSGMDRSHRHHHHHLTHSHKHEPTSPSMQDAGGGGGGKVTGLGGGSSDTNGSDSRLRAARNDPETREAQGSNPTNTNNGNNGNGNGSSGNGSNGNGNGSGSQGNGSQGNGNGSSGNGNGSSGNGHSGGSGGGDGGGSGGDGNGHSIKDSNNPVFNGNGQSSANGTSQHHSHHHHHHGHLMPRSPGYDASRYPPRTRDSRDRDGNGASGVGARPPSSEEEDNNGLGAGQAAGTPVGTTGGNGSGDGDGGADAGGDGGSGLAGRADGDGGSTIPNGSDAAGYGASVRGPRAGGTGGKGQAGVEASVGGSGSDGSGGKGNGTGSGGARSGRTDGCSVGGGGMGRVAGRPWGGGGVYDNTLRRPQGTGGIILGRAGSAFTVPPPSSKTRGVNSGNGGSDSGGNAGVGGEVSKMQSLLAQLHVHTSFAPYQTPPSGLPPTFTECALNTPTAAAQPFYQTAAAAASTVHQGLLGAMQQPAVAAVQPPPAAPPRAVASMAAAAAASKLVLPGSAADVLAAALTQIAQGAFPPRSSDTQEFPPVAALDSGLVASAAPSAAPARAMLGGRAAAKAAAAASSGLGGGASTTGGGGGAVGGSAASASAAAAYAQFLALVTSQSPRSEVTRAGILRSPPSVQDVVLQDVRGTIGATCPAATSTGAADCVSNRVLTAAAESGAVTVSRQASLPTAPLAMGMVLQQQQAVSAAASAVAAAATVAAGSAPPQLGSTQLSGLRRQFSGASHGGSSGGGGGGGAHAGIPLKDAVPLERVRDTAASSGDLQGRRRGSIDFESDRMFAPRTAGASASSGGGSRTQPQLRHESPATAPSWNCQQQSPPLANPLPKQPQPPLAQQQQQQGANRPQLSPQQKQQTQQPRGSKLVRPVASQPLPPRPTTVFSQAESQREGGTDTGLTSLAYALKRLPSGSRPGDPGEDDTPSPARKRQHQ